VHIVSVTLYSLLGALQFVPSLRRGRPCWHRIAGRILVPAGVLVALSGLWMNFLYARPPGDGESLVVVRLIVGSLMLASIVLAVFAIRRRDFPSHGAWMTRGYALALGAGTQVLTMLPWVLIFGPIGAADELPRTVLMTAGWVINLGVAEYVIRRRPAHRSNRTSVGLRRSGTAHALAT
jgi:RsiW-degrading membrane proteinase PrsW (M82 family)